NELSHRLASDADQILFKRYTLVFREDGVAHANQSVPIPYHCRDVGNLKSFWLPFASCAAQSLESFKEERSNEMRLKATRLGSFHVLANLLDARGVHGIVRERVFFDEGAKLVAI